MRILVVGPSFPFPPRWGHATRVYHLARQLARRHDVMLLTYATAADMEHVEALRRELAVEVVPREPLSTGAKRRMQLASLLSAVPYETQAAWSAAMQGALDRVCAEWRPDSIQIESTLLWKFAYPRGVPIVLDEHNLDYEVYRRMCETERSPLRKTFYRYEERRVRRYEQRAWQHVSACVLTSAREDEIVRGHARDTLTAVVSNAVDTEHFRPTDEEPVPRTIAFNGTLDYRPNVDAAEFLVHEILPRVRQRFPRARAVVVGRGRDDALARLRDAGAEATGEVADIRPYLARAAVVVAPIRAGGGTRFKVVEGLAMARPMVSTTVGCEGIDVRDGEHLLVADGADAFAAAVVRLFDDVRLGAALGHAGREFVEREYSWDGAGERLADVHERVATQASPQGVAVGSA